jgi:hypothetical protein
MIARRKTQDFLLLFVVTVTLEWTCRTLLILTAMYVTTESNSLVFTLESTKHKLTQSTHCDPKNTSRVVVPAVVEVVAVLAVVAGCAVDVTTRVGVDLGRPTVPKVRVTEELVAGTLRVGNTVVSVRVIKGATLVVDPTVSLIVVAVDGCVGAEANVTDVVCVATCMVVDGRFVLDDAMFVVVVVSTPGDITNTLVTL